MVSIDLNSDLGESLGPWTLGNDAAVLPWITSASIACGFHAGDPGVMRQTVAAAVEHGVAIGAHPGLQDLVGFGRREMRISPQEAYDIVAYQVGALIAVAAAQGARVAHVKPHGALYNMAAADAQLADAIARAVHDVDATMALFGLAGSALITAGENRGLRTLAEGFPDRGYAADGTLLPRTHAHALVHDPAEAAARAVAMFERGGIGTLCIHGDTGNAPAVAQAIHEAFKQRGIAVVAPTA